MSSVCAKCGKLVFPEMAYHLKNNKVSHFNCDHPLGYRSVREKPMAKLVIAASDKKTEEVIQGSGTDYNKDLGMTKQEQIGLDPPCEKCGHRHTAGEECFKSV